MHPEEKKSRSYRYARRECVDVWGFDKIGLRRVSMELRFQDPTFHENELTLKFLRSGKVVAKVGNGRSHYTLPSGERSSETPKAMGSASTSFD